MHDQPPCDNCRRLQYQIESREAEIDRLLNIIRRARDISYDTARELERG